MQDTVQHVERLRQYLLRMRDKAAADSKAAAAEDDTVHTATATTTTGTQAAEGSAATCEKESSSGDTQQQCVLALQQKLSEAHAQIAALQASEMQKEVELQCVQAAKALLVQSEQGLSARCKQLESGLASAQDALRTAQQNAQERSEQQQVTQRQVTALQEELRQYEEEFAGLQLSAEALQHRTEELCTTNLALRAELEASRTRLAEMAQLGEAKAQLASRVTELEAALQSSTERWAEVERYFTRLKEELTQRQALQKAQEEEQAAMSAALRACEAVNERWQARFTATHLTTEKEVSVIIPVKEESEEKEGDAMRQAACVPVAYTEEEDAEEEEEESMTALVHSLEAKTVDLAIAVHSAEQRARIAEERADTVMSTAADKTAAWFALRSALAIAQPVAEQKACEETSLRASLTASEHFVESLCAVHVELLEAYTDEMLHSVQLEAQLAMNTATTTTTTGAAVRGGAGRRRQALSHATLQEMRQHAGQP